VFQSAQSALCNRIRGRTNFPLAPSNHPLQRETSRAGPRRKRSRARRPLASSDSELSKSRSLTTTRSTRMFHHASAVSLSLGGFVTPGLVRYAREGSSRQGGIVTPRRFQHPQNRPGYLAADCGIIAKFSSLDFRLEPINPPDVISGKRSRFVEKPEPARFDRSNQV
jgi:hypothetical protein